MNKAKNIASLLLVMLTLVSCKSDHLRPDSQLDDTEISNNTIKNGNGLLIASITNGVRKGFLTDPLNSSLFYIVKSDDVEEYKKSQNTLFKSITVEYSVLNSDTYSAFGRKSQLKEYGVDGKLNVIELPAGEYALVNWKSVGPIKVFYPINFYTQYFTISENEVTYIGNLHIETLYGKNIFGITIDSGAEPACEDMSDRDLEYFDDHYKRYSSLRISKQIVGCRLRGELFSR